MRRLIVVLFCIGLCVTAVVSFPKIVMSQDCEVEVMQDSVIRSRWFPSVALITIKGENTVWRRGEFKITYTTENSRDLFWLPGTFPLLLRDAQTIYQLIIILPAWWSACCLDGSLDVMTVEVCDEITECCDSDDVVIAMLPLGLDE